MLWRIASLGNGYWSITNRQTGQAVTAPRPNPGRIVRQAAFRADDPAQQWRLEEVK